MSHNGYSAAQVAPYQYKNWYMHGGEEESPVKPYLEHLHEVFTFIGMAITSGIIGNASWEYVKNTIKEISRKSNGIFVYNEDDVNKLISSIVDYNGGFHSLPEVVKSQILEEMVGDAAAENPVISRKIALLMAEPDTPQRRRKAEILYKELFRRHMAKNQRPPPGSKKGLFWSKVNRNG